MVLSCQESRVVGGHKQGTWAEGSLHTHPPPIPCPVPSLAQGHST